MIFSFTSSEALLESRRRRDAPQAQRSSSRASGGALGNLPMMTAAIFSVLVVLIMLGFPIALCMGLTAAIFFVVLGEIDTLLMLPARMYSSSTSFTLLAIPFFILVGNLMNTGGMTMRIFRLAQCA
jgi:TRAP-type mannitol/chloroaromatic compound transport system permease large subunit